MMDGWQTRYDDWKNLLVACCALPVYQVHLRRKAPKFHDLVKQKKKHDDFADLTHEELLALASE